MAKLDFKLEFNGSENILETKELVKMGIPILCADLTARDTIPSGDRLVEGKYAKAQVGDKIYKLEGGTANTNWEEVVTGVDEAQLNNAIETKVNETVPIALATKADKTALNTEKVRIDNLIAVEATTDNAETADVRVGIDGAIYTSAGTAVRSQLANINKVYEKTKEPLLVNFKQGTLSTSGVWSDNAKTLCSVAPTTILKNGVYSLTYNDADGYIVQVLRATSAPPATLTFVNTVPGKVSFYNMGATTQTYFLVKKIVETVEQDITVADLASLNFEFKYVSDENTMFEYSGVGRAFQMDFAVGDRIRITATRDNNTKNLAVRLTTDDVYNSSSTNNVAVKTWGKQDCVEEITIDKEYKLIFADFDGANTGTLKVEKISKVEDEIRQVIGRAPKTVSIDYGELVAKAMNDAGTLAAASKSLSIESLQVIPGDRYRISVNEGFAIVLNYYNTVLGARKLYKYNTRMMEVIFDESIVNITFQKNGLTDFPLSESSNMGLKIEHVIWENRSDMFDFIVAASDSSERDKARADLVCDGVNDEIEIECAVNCNVTKGFNSNIMLMPGTYWIDKFYKTYDGTTEGRGYNAVRTNLSVRKANQYSTKINARYRDYVSYGSDTQIVISESCYNDLVAAGITKADEYSMFGALRVGGTNMGAIVTKMGLEMNNMFVSPFELELPICCIDGIGFSMLGVDNLNLGRYAKEGMSSTIFTHGMFNIPDGSIGIRGTHGSNRGVGNYIKKTRIAGFYEDLALTGEHYIIEDTLMHSGVYGFTVGNYPCGTQMEHPNVFIGCSVEQCINFGLLNRYGATEESEVDNPEQTIIWIGGSTEAVYNTTTEGNKYMAPIVERVKGAYRGRFETDYSAANPIFAPGSGKFIEIRNYSRRTYGPATSRPSFLDEGHQYYDTTSKKLLYVRNGVFDNQEIMKDKALSGDVYLAISPATVGSSAATIATDITANAKFTREVTLTLRTNKLTTNYTHLWYDGSMSAAVTKTSAEGLVSIVGGSTINFTDGVATVTLEYTGTWAVGDTATLTVTGGTVLGYTVANKTSVDTVVA